MQRRIRILDIVALTADVPQCGLVCGHVGTIVESLEGDTYEVEFSDDQGKTYAQAPLKPSQLMVLHHRPVKAQ